MDARTSDHYGSVLLDYTPKKSSFFSSTFGQILTMIRCSLRTSPSLPALLLLLFLSPPSPTFSFVPYSPPPRTSILMSTSSTDPAPKARSLHLFTTTPLLPSLPLSNLCAPHRIYLKLDCLQRSGSFKDRGMGHLCATLSQRRHNSNNNDDECELKFISSSGGNAGLAVATVAASLPRATVEVVVPTTTKPIVIDKLKALGAKVTVHGAVWNEADRLARQMVEGCNRASGDAAVYVSPYDDPLLWTGHSTVVDEIVDQIADLERGDDASQNPARIGAVLASVGGGGLLSGILEGIERNYNGGDEERAHAVRGVKVVACETEGAASFAASWEASSSEDGGGQDVKVVRLEGIQSVATSLGALEVTPAVIERSHRHRQRGRDCQAGDDVVSYVCTDMEAVDACLKFAADHRILVEPACGAALAPLYSERLRERLLREMGEEECAIVVEVCGGSGVSLELLEGWRQQFLM